MKISIRKSTLSILMSFAAFPFFSCNTAINGANKIDVERKQAFVKVLGLLKNKKVDSLRLYFSDPEQADFTNHEIEIGCDLMQQCNDRPILDSITLYDSTMIRHTRFMLYKYLFHCYSDTGYIGTIKVSFYEEQNKVPVNLFVDKPYRGIDTAGLMKEIIGQ